jgi:hypothetical protein
MILYKAHPGHELGDSSEPKDAFEIYQEIKDMEIKEVYTLEELRKAAGEQNLRIEEKHGMYRVVRTVSDRFGLVVVKAGTGYSLSHDGLREFLIFNSIDIGERITDWSKKHEPKLH